MFGAQLARIGDLTRDLASVGIVVEIEIVVGQLQRAIAANIRDAIRLAMRHTTNAE